MAGTPVPLDKVGRSFLISSLGNSPSVIYNYCSVICKTRVGICSSCDVIHKTRSGIVSFRMVIHKTRSGICISCEVIGKTRSSICSFCIVIHKTCSGICNSCSGNFTGFIYFFGAFELLYSYGNTFGPGYTLQVRPRSTLPATGFPFLSLLQIAITSINTHCKGPANQRKNLSLSKECCYPTQTKKERDFKYPSHALKTSLYT